MSFCLLRRVHHQAAILLVGWRTGVSPRKGDRPASTNNVQLCWVDAAKRPSRCDYRFAQCLFSLEKKKGKIVQFLRLILLRSVAFEHMETLRAETTERSCSQQPQRASAAKTYPTTCFHAKQRADVRVTLHFAVSAFLLMSDKAISISPHTHFKQTVSAFINVSFNNCLEFKCNGSVRNESIQYS